MTGQYDAVLFDLLSALLDSWSLWENVAGSKTAGQRWRLAYLRRTYAAGAYRPYQTLVADAAVEAGLGRHLADNLAARYGELRAWPCVSRALAPLVAEGLPLGIVTNCSDALGRIAATRVPAPFAVVVTAERAGFYKPDPHPYRLALTELGVSAERCLFVAGSAYDLLGASRVGLPVWWHNRIGMTQPTDAPLPLRHSEQLEGFTEFVLNNHGEEDHRP
jgi:2-haloalkanoic acid dehalogenase type II